MDSDHEAILRLMNEYCYRIDAGDLAGFAALFSHGRWQLAGDPAGGDQGAAAVLETLQQVILYDGSPCTRHLMSNVEIDRDESGESAIGRCYITVLQSVPPDFPPQIIFAGDYRDEFGKRDGRWCFLSREITPVLVGDLSRHRRDMT